MSINSNGQYPNGQMADLRGRADTAHSPGNDRFLLPPDEGRRGPEAAHTAATAYTLDELRHLAFECEIFPEMGKRMKQCKDPVMSKFLWIQWRLGTSLLARTLSLSRLAVTLEEMGRQGLAECPKSKFLWFCIDLEVLHHRWTVFTLHSKLNTIDWSLSLEELLKSKPWRGVDPFFDGHEVEYRGFRMNGTRLLRVFDAFDSFLENRRAIPVATEAAANGRRSRAPADRFEGIGEPGRRILLALDELGVWSQEDSALRSTILKQAGIKRDTRNAKLLAIFVNLKGKELIETLTGPSGGTWLTPKGREFVAIYRDGRATNAINRRLDVDI